MTSSLSDFAVLAQRKKLNRYGSAQVGAFPVRVHPNARERLAIQAARCSGRDIVRWSSRPTSPLREFSWSRNQWESQLPSERARSFTPTYLTKGPPGSVIQFAGVEAQVRSASGIAVLASTYSYHAPGFL